MATLSSDGKYVTVVKGDTLWDIAEKYLGSGTKYKTLAAINDISNPDLIFIGQKIYLTDSGSSSSSSSSSSSNCATIKHFGLLSTSDNTLFATWNWSKIKTTDSYKVQWSYDTGDGVWFSGGNTNVTADADSPVLSRQSTYSIPSGARRVRFKVKPISKTKKDSEGNETSYWTASWSDVNKATWTNATPLDTPSVPTVKIEKYKLTASLENIDIDGATGIIFAIVKNNQSKIYNRSKVVTITGSRYAAYSCNVDAGGEYKVCCRAYNKKNNTYSEWTDYSNNVGTIPAAPKGITTIRANSETSVYLKWGAVATATSYDIEYATKKSYFDGSDQTTIKNNVEFTHYEITGLESGTEYFFRIRAVNDKGGSAWTGIKSVVIGTDPAAPTTWSSATTVISGEPLTLYWVHNSEDGSSQTYADLELYIGGVKETHTIKNTTDEDEKDKTSSYVINTSSYIEGTKIQWRVRTAGITKAYGDWSIQRTVDIYAPPTQELSITDIEGVDINVLTSFPFYVYALAGPNTQVPIGYHLTVTSNEVYETVDSVGNAKTVSAGEQVYSKYFDIQSELLVEFSAGNIDLENNISYTVTSTVAMDSGLTNEKSAEFTVSWSETSYEPNAEIGVDKDTLTASIRPYCEDVKMVNYEVTRNSTYVYEITENTIGQVWGQPVAKAKTTAGEQVYLGVTADETEVYYCTVEDRTPVTNVLLSVYRREFDGSFTELAVNLDGEKPTVITDPHPALDFARYRIVATSKTTGTVSYYDPPGHPMNGTSVIIQWDEDWSSFETSEDDVPEQPPWSGSLLKLPYNIDVSDSHAPDVQLVEYIGRSHPVSYYGTQLGSTSTWNVEIAKDDEETLYALRRLARYMGDVYVREPSGSGYWANVTVSFNQTHCKPSIPVSLTITRVEGGA